mmetsp:Transcript_8342/g.9832  ORF Transcript_8342/g.9832 Transcript_8342/m.9832 type:complete len:115 (+) Transcript_8342:3-347(+)
MHQDEQGFDESKNGSSTNTPRTDSLHIRRSQSHDFDNDECKTEKSFSLDPESKESIFEKTANPSGRVPNNYSEFQYESGTQEAISATAQLIARSMLLQGTKNVAHRYCTSVRRY